MSTAKEEEDEAIRQEAIMNSSTELVGEICHQKMHHTSVFKNFQNPYDEYFKFITKAKEEIPKEKLLELRKLGSSDCTYEQILSPDFVMFFALQRLKKITNTTE